MFNDKLIQKVVNMEIALMKRGGWGVSSLNLRQKLCEKLRAGGAGGGATAEDKGDQIDWIGDCDDTVAVGIA